MDILLPETWTQKTDRVMKILFLCNKSPWPPREGGPMAMNMFVEGLANAGHRVKVLAVNSYKYNIRSEDIPESYKSLTGIELIDLDLRLKPADALVSLIKGRSYHLDRFDSATFRRRLIEVLKKEQFDIVQLETLFMCPYIPDIREHSKASIVLRAHNVEHRIWERIAATTRNPVKRWYIGQLAKALKKYEVKFAESVDGIVAITPEDAGAFETMLSSVPGRKVPVTDVPFGIDPERYAAPAHSETTPSLFSLGAMNWIPNQKGILWFLDNVWPDLHRQFPDLRYYLGGREMPEWMLNLERPNVVVLGEVPDAIEFMSAHSVMVVPLFSGSGIRIKIIEGMAAGRAIVSTTIGAEGIRATEGKEILIADTPCGFFEAVALCVGDPALCGKIGREARLLAENEYNTAGLLRKLTAFYAELAG